MTKFSLFKTSVDRDDSAGPRRLARELALRLLCQHDSGASDSPEETLELFHRSFAPERDNEAGLEISAPKFQAAWPFAEQLFSGVCLHLSQIDQQISRVAANWQLGRMSLIDRNLLRLAYYEMAYLEDIPAKVSLNEAIELAKQYGAEDSGSFINGLLDRLLNDLSAK